MTVATTETTTRPERRNALLSLLGNDRDLYQRFCRIRDFSRKVRASEYHITNACNIRCKGCWFFVHEFDKKTRDLKDIATIRDFVRRQRDEGGITAGILIGGEPAVVPERVSVFVEELDYVTISTNGLKKLPVEGFEHVSVLISLFGGGRLDDELRAIKPSGKRFSGLFDTALGHYRNDPRARFIYAITEDGIPYIEETVRRIRDNGNRTTFNFYSKYDTNHPLRQEHEKRLMEEALRVRDKYPETVLSTPFYIRAMITGKTKWGSFGYDVCPSLSTAHPQHAVRIANGNPVLPGFNVYAADYKTLNFCCTSGHCEDCRDSQAVMSWLLVNMSKFRGSREDMTDWIELAESYWSQFIWSPVQRQEPAPANIATAV